MIELIFNNKSGIKISFAGSFSIIQNIGISSNTVFNHVIFELLEKKTSNFITNNTSGFYDNTLLKSVSPYQIVLPFGQSNTEKKIMAAHLLTYLELYNEQNKNDLLRLIHLSGNSAGETINTIGSIAKRIPQLKGTFNLSLGLPNTFLESLNKTQLYSIQHISLKKGSMLVYELYTAYLLNTQLNPLGLTFRFNDEQEVKTKTNVLNLTLQDHPDYIITLPNPINNYSQISCDLKFSKNFHFHKTIVRGVSVDVRNELLDAHKYLLNSLNTIVCLNDGTKVSFQAKAFISAIKKNLAEFALTDNVDTLLSNYNCLYGKHIKFIVEQKFNFNFISELSTKTFPVDANLQVQYAEKFNLNLNCPSSLLNNYFKPTELTSGARVFHLALVDFAKYTNYSMK